MGKLEADSVDASAWYLDHDGDTFGDSGFKWSPVVNWTGYAGDTDCNDLVASINVLGTEIATV